MSKEVDLSLCAVRFNMSYDFVCDLYKLCAQFLQTAPSSQKQAATNIKVRCNDLNKMREQFDSNFSLLVAHTKDDAVKQAYEKKFSQFYEMFYSIQTIKCDLFEPIEAAPKPKSVDMHSNFHLPKIALTHFKGAHTEWPNFIAVFNSMIHNNGDLCAIQKLHYLLSVLEQEPLNLVKHLPLSNENYSVAYKLLVDRYENKRLIADKHLEQILSASCQTLTCKNLKRFVNTLNENIQALKALGFDTESWSFVLFHLISRKLPAELRTKFEFLIKPNEIPTFQGLLEFLENHLRVLETTSQTSISSAPKSTSHVATLHIASVTCQCCGGDHAIYQCSQFDSVKDKRAFVVEKKLCFNCLRPHFVSKCLSKSCCQICKGRHHTKLHEDLSKSADTGKGPESSGQVLLNVEPQSTGLLGTALVGVQDVDGQVHVVRALIDPGAQSSLVTESLAQLLRLPRRKSSDLFGVGEQRQPTHGKVDCHISPLTNDSAPGLSTEAIVLKRITGYQPAAAVSPLVPEKCNHLQLADQTFNVPGRIDLLLGVDLFGDIFCGSKQRLGKDLPTAHSTIFGWVIMGPAPVTSTHYQNLSLLTSSESRLEITLNKFWESEEPPLTPLPDPEDVICEKHFVDTHSRDSDGRFVVRLPFKVESKQIGDTRLVALKRFHNLERRLLKEPKLRELYTDFMRDYLDAGHMRAVSDKTIANRYYIPHHGVLKESSSTTKLRAVFDASLSSSTGVSLNQTLMSGPKLQENIQDIILRFRTYQVVFTCDIRQMYRNVRLHDDDCRYQTIFWRESPDQPLQEYELTTVTYGVSSSAFQAIRVLHELANINQATHPDASRVLREDTFVDDIVSGSQTLDGAKELQQQVVDVLAQGCFQLRKWSSNHDELLKDLPSDHRETPYRFEDSGDIFKILGIEWNPSSDEFLYRVSNLNKKFTKRGILSDIARLYDPCGFIAPVTFYAKSFMQSLWLLDLSWDDPLPDEALQSWLNFVNDFPSLNQLRIPRLVLSGQPSTRNCQLHGFSDASERGYAACVYLRVDDGEDVELNLLMAKSRVASCKQKQTVPKLELCGALLLAQLIEHVYKILHHKIEIASSTAWCDSTIALTWIHTSPHKLQTFEGNRVSQIQGMLPDTTWKYVPSALNPADSASRGLLPSELITHNLWWGPSWLKSNTSSWPNSCQLVEPEDLPGLKPSVAAHVAQTVKVTDSTSPTVLPNAEVDENSQPMSVAPVQAAQATVSCSSTSPATVLVAQAVEKPTSTCINSTPPVLTCSDTVEERYSSLSKLKAVVGWCQRFIHNARYPNDKLTGPLTLQELDKAFLTCVKSAQSSVFAETISSLRSNKPLKGNLRRLHPFLNSGLLRVGGRLVNCSLPYDNKHPLLLPKSHHLTNLIIDHFHQLYGHPGPATLMAILQRRFWILTARSVVRQRIFKCQRCFRLKAKPMNPFMGNLPARRVNQARPFQNVGLDFGGPFTVKDSSLRKPRTYKAYLCVFVCYATKATHLEVVSELSTDAFIACLDRFVARRGLPTDIHSDCGRNFLGARNYLKEIYELTKQIERDTGKIERYLACREITWHLNPPSGPHFGGLWESAVKSAKNLLKRIVGDRVLTFEELSTIFCKVESILNSRPLTPLSSDPSDLEVLTPGHFLIGQPLLALPERDLCEVSVHRLRRWQLLQQITQSFWKRWHREYLHTLQQRGRWLKSEQNLQVGDLVVIVEPNLPPLQWRMARVTKLYPGTDGAVRVVDVKTATGSLQRPVVKLCKLHV